MKNFRTQNNEPATRGVTTLFSYLRIMWFSGCYLMIALLFAEHSVAQQQPGVLAAPAVAAAAADATSPRGPNGGGITSTSNAGSAPPAPTTGQNQHVAVLSSATVTTSPQDGSTTTSPGVPNGVEIEVGVASRIAGHGVPISNYQSTNGVLSLTSLGRATPQLLTGLGFSCDTSTTTSATAAAGSVKENPPVPSGSADKNDYCNKHWTKHLGAFVSVQFGAGSNQTITGYSVGATFAVYKYLRLLAGFSLSPTNEVSPGFAHAAADYVTRNVGLFPGISPAALSSNAYGAFDGIQTTSTVPVAGAAPTAVVYYPGSVTETRYRGGFLIGVALPINIFNLFSGNNKTNQASTTP